MPHFRCPYCQHDQTSDGLDFDEGGHELGAPARGLLGYGRISWVANRCKNPVCQRTTLAVRAGEHSAKSLFDRRILPESAATVWPDYVPAHIRAAYEQACRIVDLAPDASATSSRKCLQAMIRDRWPEQVAGLKHARLKDEIDAIKSVVDAMTWQAIDKVRSRGNIGAHFDADVDRIVEIDPDEAQLLIALLETLASDWYVQRHERERLLEQITQIGTASAVDEPAPGEASTP